MAADAPGGEGEDLTDRQRQRDVTQPSRPARHLALVCSVGLSLALAGYGGPDREDTRHQFSQVHMGLPVRLVLYAADEATARRAATVAFGRVAALDAMMSDYRQDSELRRLRPGRWTRVSPELFEVIRRALALARATDGAFDPTIGPVASLWREARRARRLPDRAALDEARARVGWRAVELNRRSRAVRLNRPGMSLDLGGIAKGWILQDARRVLAELGLARVLIEAGGDIVVGEAPPGADGWRIETPGAEASFSRRASRLTRAALATSGPTAQFVEIDGIRYSHVVDPRTGVGLTNRVIANVIAPDGATADGLATALTVLGTDGVRRIAARFPGVLISVRPVDGVRGYLPPALPVAMAPMTLPRNSSRSRLLSIQRTTATRSFSQSM